MKFPESSDTDTSSESDIAEITDISEMREIISRMDDDDDGDHDKCVPLFPCNLMPGQSCIPALCMPTLRLKRCHLSSAGLTQTLSCPIHGEAHP